MKKDERYEVVRELIDSGRISEFRHIFKYIPKTVVAHDLGTNTTRMTRLIENVEELTIEDLRMIGNLIEVSYHAILQLVIKQYDKYLQAP
jgi:hypothetical protein